MEERVETRLHKYLSLIPMVDQSFPYNPDICDLPPDLMFMHEAIFGGDDYTPNIDLCADFHKENMLDVRNK